MTRGDKTHAAGEGLHTGWLPARNILFCIDASLGLCLLYRFCSRREPFPVVCDDGGGTRPGYLYKWLPVIISTESTYSLDTKKALLPFRGVCSKSQNECFHQLHVAAEVPEYLGDSVTHAGRAAAQQEAQKAGVDPVIVDKAIGNGKKSVQQLHYDPHAGFDFRLQRAGYEFRSEYRAEVDAPQLRVMREQAVIVRQLVDLVLPELAEQEAIVAAISILPATKKSRKARADQARANTESHVREHQNFLKIVRNYVSLAIIGATCRPRLANGAIAYDQQSLLDQHGSGPIYSAIRFRTGEWRDRQVWEHPLFAQIAEAVTAAEERERDHTIVSPSRRKTAEATAEAVAGRLGSQLERIEEKLESSAADASAAAASAAAATATREARELDRIKRGRASPSPEQREIIFRESAASTRSILSFASNPPPSPSPPPPSTAVADPPMPPPVAEASDAALPPANSGRKRRADETGLDHADLGSFSSVHALWTEYVGPDGNSGLRQRGIDNPNWRRGNKASRDLFNDKCFFYREIMRQMRELGSLSAALDAAESRRLPYASERYGAGLTRMLKVLQSEQKDAASKAAFNRMLDDLDTAS